MLTEVGVTVAVTLVVLAFTTREALFDTLPSGLVTVIEYVPAAGDVPVMSSSQKPL